MKSFKTNLFFSFFLPIFLIVPSLCKYFTPPEVPRLTNLLPPLSFNQGFSKIFGGSNIQFSSDGSSANLTLDKISGAGLVSKNIYHYGFFSAAIKLPSGFSSGVVVAFYLSNSDVFPHTHDEIDIELLGHDRRNDWVFQTNIYANGSVATGREEKFYLWFDPTLQHHEYSIIWNNHHIVFLVDNIPVREYVHTQAFSSVYPSKPMSVRATIWDGSEWATHGGKYPVNYKYAPFMASITKTEMVGGSILNKTSFTSHSGANISSFDPVDGPEFVKLSQQQISALDWARRKLMFYSYCKDTARYKILPPECK